MSPTRTKELFSTGDQVLTNLIAGYVLCGSQHWARSGQVTSHLGIKSGLRGASFSSQTLFTVSSCHKRDKAGENILQSVNFVDTLDENKPIFLDF